MTPTLSNRALKELEHARTAMASGLLDRARAAIKEAERLDPDSVEIRLASARIHMQLGDPEQAMRAVDAMMISDTVASRQPEAMLLRAAVMIRSGWLDHAESLLADFVENFPHDVRPRRMLAGLCVERGRLDLALAHLRMVMMFEPSDSSVRRTIASLLEQADPQEAVSLLLNDRHDSGDPAIRLRAATLLATIGRDADAEALFKDLIDEFPNDAGMLIDAGELALRQGSIELAIKRLQAAIQLTGSHSARAFAALGRATMRAGRPVAAARLWWKAASRSEHHDDVIHAMAHIQVCALSVGRVSLVDRVRRRLAPSTTSTERRMALAQAWQNTTIAVEDSGTADGIDAGDSPLIKITQRAVATLAHHAATHPEFADAWYHEAVCQTTLGDYDDARNSVQQALQLNPHYRAAASLAANLGHTNNEISEAA